MTRGHRQPFVAMMAAFSLYVLSYWYVRQTNTVQHFECDGCPIGGWEEIKFPADGMFLVYAPMYQLDKLTSTNSEFVAIRHR